MEDKLIVVYDNCPPDVPALVVTRKDKHNITILNTFTDDEAIEMYNKLVGHNRKCGTCKHFSKLVGHFGHTFCKHDSHCGDIVPEYVVCDCYEQRK